MKQSEKENILTWPVFYMWWIECCKDAVDATYARSMLVFPVGMLILLLAAIGIGLLTAPKQPKQ